MESFLGRYRNLIILVGVLFLQALGLAVQVKRNDSGNTRLVRVWAIEAITPFERVLVSVQNSCGDIWHNYFYLRGVRAENHQLKEQIERMRLEEVRLSQDAEQAHRLQALLAFKEQEVAKTVAAQVIGSSGSDLSRLIYIDKGSNDGIAQDMAVITADGIVGKVLLVYPSVAQVLLINDQSSGVGVILEKSRLQGVLRGTANGEVVLERVMSDEQVGPGEKLLSSGGDQIFPKGMPVGTVAKVSQGKDLFLNIKVKPSADLSRLEEVLVVTEKRDRQAVAENTERVRAADILAQRLPSVPDKPPADAAISSPSAGSANASGSVAGAASATPGSNSGAMTGTKPKSPTAPKPRVPAESGTPPRDGGAQAQSVIQSQRSVTSGESPQVVSDAQPIAAKTSTPTNSPKPPANTPTDTPPPDSPH
jgi:rod shape-determining protein MreC